MKTQNLFCPSFLWTFTQNRCENVKKEKNNDKTPYFWSNKFTPAKQVYFRSFQSLQILHNLVAKYFGSVSSTVFFLLCLTFCVFSAKQNNNKQLIGQKGASKTGLNPPNNFVLVF